MADEKKTPAKAEPATYTTPDGRVLPLKTALEYDENGSLVRPAAYQSEDGSVRVEA